MNFVQESLATTLQDIRDMEEQIETILKGLCQDNLLGETGLSTIFDNNVSPKSAGEQPNKKGNETKKKSGLSALSTKKGRIEAKPRDTEEAQNEVESSTGLHSTCSSSSTKPVVSVEDEDTFLFPFMDEWYFGVILKNTSKTTIELPSVLLNPICAEANGPGQQAFSTSFPYSYKARLVNRDTHDSHGKQSDLPTIKVRNVLPGGKFIVTASFRRPVMRLDSDRRMYILVSLLLGTKNIWSKSIPFDCKTAATLAHDELLLNPDERILTAVNACSCTIYLDFVGSNARSSFFDFIMENLGMDLISSVGSKLSTRKTEYYAVKKLNYFWGMSAQIEEEDKDDTLRCVICTRTSDQLYFFHQLFHDWIELKNETRTTVRVNKASLPESTLSIKQALENENKTIMHFLYLYQHSDVGGSKIQPKINYSNAKKNKAANWLQTFVQEMCILDDSVS